MFSSHIAMDRRHALAQGVPLPDACTGAALFADISGFTGLVDTLLKQHGPSKGAEEVQAVINPVFEGLIAGLHRFGGSVISFAGDAIICWLDDSGPGEPGRAAARAVAAGLEMQRAVRRLADATSVRRAQAALDVTIAVAAGPARRFLVGDPEQLRLDAIAGATLDRMAQAERLASAGQLVVAPCVMDAVGPRQLRTQGLGDGYHRVDALRTEVAQAPWSPAHRAADNEASTFVRAAIRGHLELGTSMLGDLRLACPMFLRADGIDYDADPEAATKLDRLVRWAQRVTAGFDGAVHELIIGDKGTYLYIVFGAPVAHGDDTERAVRAAAVLSHPANDLGLDVHTTVGLSRGRVFTGVCGGSDRHCYAVLGAEVNVAARLMSRADAGQCLVSESVVRECFGTHAFADLGGHLLKGRDEPVPIFALEGERQSPPQEGPRARPVGREDELRHLAALLEAAQHGETRLALLTGEPGVGKSVLTDALIAAAEDSGFDCTFAAATSVTRGTAWRPWRSPIARRLGVQQDLADTEALRASVLLALDAIDPQLTQRAPLLNAVLPLSLEDSETTRWMTGEVRGDNTLELLLRVIRGPAGGEREHPMLIVLDDAQWADSSSWRLLERCVHEIDHALVLVVARPLDEGADLAAIPPSCMELLSAPATQRLALSGLAAEASCELIAATLDCDSVPDELLDTVSKRASGHPFYTVELTRSLRDSGIVQVEGRGCTLTGDLSDVEFPSSIEGVITARIDRMRPVEQQTLKVASVFGHRFEADAVERVFPLVDSRPDVATALQEIERRELTSRDAAAQQPAYTFRHLLTRDVAYGLLLHAQRRELHASVADFVERHHRNDLDAWHAVLAHHWEHAGKLARAVDCLEQAGEAAHEGGAFREVVTCLERAQSLSPPTLEARRGARWLARLSNAWYRLGDLDRSRTTAEQAVAALDRPIPRGPALLRAVAGQLTQQLRHRRAPERFLDRAPGDEKADRRAAVRLYTHLSEVYYLAGDLPRSIYTAVRVVNLGEHAGPSAELVEAYGLISIISAVAGRHAWSRRYSELAWDLANELDTPPARAIVRHQGSLHNAASGNFERVRQNEREAASIYRELGDVGRLRDVLGVHGTTEYLAGRYDEAEELLQGLIDTQRGDEAFIQRIWGAGWLGAIAIKRGEPARAQEWLEQSLGLLDASTLGLMEVSVRGMLAVASEQLGRRQAAAVLADETFDLIAATKGRPSAHISIDGYLAVADLFHAWSGDDARISKPQRAQYADRAATMRRYIQAFARMFRIGQPIAFMYEGIEASMRGRRDTAERRWHDGVRVAERVGMPFEAARIRYERATRTVEAGVPRAEALEDVLQEFSRIGAHAMAAQTQAQLEKESHA